MANGTFLDPENVSDAPNVSRLKRIGATLTVTTTLFSVGMATVNLSPLLISGLERRLALDPASGGLLITLELVTTAILTHLFSRFSGHFRAKHLAFVGCMIAAGADFGSCIGNSLVVLCILRLVSALGSALCICAGNAAFAAQRDPERISGNAFALNCALYAVLYPIATKVEMSTMGGGSFAFEGGFVAILALIMVFLPFGQAAHVSSARHAVNDRLPRMALFPVISAFLVVLFGVGYFASAGSFATTASISSDGFGYSLSLATAASVAGSWCAARFVRGHLAMMGITAIFILYLVFSSLLALAHGGATYFLALVVSQAAFGFLYATILGFCAASDKFGRLSAQASSATLLGAAVAPAFVGWLIEVGGSWPIISVTTGGIVLAALTFVVAERKMGAKYM